MNLDFIICGVEHSGTTLVSDLFRQVPGLDSGFEVGVLLRDTPRKFPTVEPFCNHMEKGWGITIEQFQECCDTDDFEEFYRRLGTRSSLLSEDTKQIFDKTPRYLLVLNEVLARCPGKKIIICYKDPRATIFSDLKRAKPEDVSTWYAEHMPAKLGYMKNCYTQFERFIEHPQVIAVSLEELAMNARETKEKMFQHVDRKYELTYSIMKDLRYRHTRSNTVSADIVFEYLGNMDRELQNRIVDDFADLKEWFYT